MKKLSFLLGITAMFMASCSNDEVVDVAQTQGIGFNTFVDKATRATDQTDLNANTLEKFAVYGVTWKENAKEAPSAVFTNQEVYKETRTEGGAETSEWTYKPLRFWAAGNSYRFSAVAPYDVKGLTVKQSLADIENYESVKGGLELTFDNEAAKAAVDLCYAFKKLSKVEANQDAVDLSFSHMLSRVKFTFQNGFPSEQSAIEIKNIKITDATTKATINKVNDEQEWTVANDAKTFEISFKRVPLLAGPGYENLILGGTNAEGKARNNHQETEHQYIIPLNVAKAYTVSFEVTLYNYDPDPNSKNFKEIATYKHTVTLPVIDFNANFSYNFIANIDYTNIDPAGQLYPIKFNPSVSTWEGFTDSDVTVKQGTGSEEPAA